MNVKHLCFSTGMFDKEIERLESASSSLPAGTMWTRIHSSSSWDSFSISQVLHGIFSATTNSKLVLFILLAWNSLQRRDNSVNNPPLLAYITGSFANGSARFMRRSYKAHLANDMTVSLKLIRFNHQQSLLAPTERWICLANCAPVTVRVFVVCMCERMHVCFIVCTDLEQLPQSCSML